MTQTQVKLKFTLEDYRNLPESETKRYELLGCYCLAWSAACDEKPYDRFRIK